MIDLLNRPYPFIHGGVKTSLIVAAFIFVFVFIFLLVFQPFQMSQSLKTDVVTGSAIYAISSALTGFIMMGVIIYGFPSWANEDSWTIGREIVAMNILLIAIGLTNAFVGWLVGFCPPGIEPTVFTWVTHGLWHTYLVGFFPILIITFVNYTILLKQNMAASAESNLALDGHIGFKDVIEAIRIESANGAPAIEFYPDELLFVMSNGNYVEFHLNKNGEQVREIQRNTLSFVASQLKEMNQFFQSHRAYIVNLNKVSESFGNAQGYRLKLVGSRQTIPVSRAKLTQFDRLLTVQ